MRASRAVVVLAAFVAACSQGGKKDAGSTSGKGTYGTNYVVSVSRPTGGTITSGDGKINCGPGAADAPPCSSATFPWTQKVTLSANPDPGYVFITWAGDCSNLDACSFDMTVNPGADKWVVAVFNKDNGDGALGHGNYTNGAVHGPEYYKYLQWKDSGAPSPPAGTRDCLLCHGRDYGGQGIAPSCNACHLASGGTPAPPGGLVPVGTNCKYCHGNVGMDANTSNYHHVLTADVGANGVVYPTSSTPFTCTSCHVKHDRFTASSKGNNLRDAIVSVPLAGAATDLGICISCHLQGQTKSQGQSDDGTVVTPALDATAFGASPHAYLVQGSFNGSGNDFQVGCVKCHNSDVSASTLQDGTYKFSLHASADRRLRAKLGRTTLVDDDGEGLCFRCHSTAVDAIGGVKKSTDVNDWYGAVTNMAAGATNVYAQSQKGSSAKAPAPVTTNTLYFKPGGEETVSSAVTGLAGTSDPVSAAASTLFLSSTSAPEPVANLFLLTSSITQSVSGSTLYFQNALATPPGFTVPQSGDTLGLGTQDIRDMLVTTPTSNGTDSTQLNSTSPGRVVGVSSFVSPPMTTATTVPAGNWVVNVQGRKTGTGNNNATQVAAYARYYVYVWKADATKVTVAGPTTDTTALTSGNVNRALTATVANPVALGIGDRMVVDLEAQVSNTVTGGNFSYTVGQAYTNLTVPGTNTFSFGTTSSYNTTTFRNGSLALVPGSSSSNRNSSTTANIVSWDRVSQFTTPALTAPYTLRSGSSLSLTVRTSQTNSLNGCYLQWAAYRWTATDAVGETLGVLMNGEPGAPISTPFPTTAANQTLTITTASDVAFAAGDKLMIEVQVYKNGTNTASNGCTVTYGGPTDQSNLTIAASDGAVPSFLQALSGNTWMGLSMSPGAPAGANVTVGSAETASAGSLTQHWKRASFVSPPVRTATTLASAPWQLNVWDSASNANVLARVRYRVSVWTAANTAGSDILPWTTDGQFPGTTAAQQAITTAPGAAVSLAAGDRVVVELEVATSSATGGSATNQYWLGTTSRSNLVLPSAVEFTYPETNVAAWGRHDFAVYRGLHKPNALEETQAYLGANKHVGCEDCHNPHAAGATSHANGTNLIGVGSPLAGVSGQAPTFDGPFTAATGYTQLTPAAHEYEVCFKCHSGANPNLAAWNAGWTDLAVAFNPANASTHPVVSALGSSGNTSAPLTAAQLINGWTPGRTMYCSDCHGNDDTAGTAAQGPHASAARFILKGPNTQWPFQADGITRWATDSSSPYTFAAGLGTSSGLFCFNCHPAFTSGIHTRGDHNNTACTGCHLRLPHGGKVKRLIRTTDTPAPYADTGTTAELKSYAGGVADGNTSCGANCTTHHNLTPSVTNKW